MNRTVIGAVTLLFLFLANPLVAQPARELRGQVFHLGENGEKIFEPGLIVTLVETGATDDANDQGIFRLPLPPAFQPGDSVTISIDKPGWRIRFPLDGEARVPRNLLREVVPVELLQVGSKLFWTNDRIEKFIRDASERSKQEGRREGENDAPSLDLGREIKDWVAKYGFSAQEAQQEIDRWIAEVEAAHEDSYQKGLAAFAKQQFDTAAERFRDSAEWRIRKLDETRKQQEKLAEKAERLWEEVVRDLRMEGDSHYYAYRYEKALTVYEQAHKYTSKDRTPQLWGATLNDIGRAHRELGIRVAAESSAHIASAVQAARQALLVFSRSQLSQDWAATQNNLGNTLTVQARYKVDKEGAELLVEAIQAHRQALLVYTREQMPQDWALTQLYLGNALSVQAERTTREEGTELLVEAVQAYQQALLVFTREQMPQQWAQTQYSLGFTFHTQGTLTSDEESDQLFSQAVQAFQQALLVYTREQMPQQWARTQYYLGHVLGEQGAHHASGEEGVQLIAQAVQAFQQALLVYTRDQLPQQWAMTQNDLGRVLAEQGIHHASRDEGVQLLAQAVQAYRQALLVYTREQLPKQWAITHGFLGSALTAQGMRAEGKEGVQLIAQAVQSYQQALLVYTREQMPQPWARSHHRLGEILAMQGMRASGEERAQLLAQAAQAFQQALLVYTREQMPQDWARTHNQLGAALAMQGMLVSGEDGAHFLIQAVNAYQQALLVRTPDHFPQLWASTRSNEAEALFALHRYEEAANALSQVLAKDVDARIRIVALGYAIAAGLAMDSADVLERVEELLGLVVAQPQGFKTSWMFEGTLHSLGKDPEVPHKDLLIRLFQALGAPDRDSLLDRLREWREALLLERNPAAGALSPAPTPAPAPPAPPASGSSPRAWRGGS